MFNKVAFCLGSSGTASPQASGGNCTKRSGGSAGKKRQQYQEKQRLQIEALQELLNGKLAEFSAVASENDTLRQKLRVLETVLPASEQHLASLTFEQGSTPWELMEELFIFDDDATTESVSEAFSPCATNTTDMNSACTASQTDDALLDTRSCKSILSGGGAAGAGSSSSTVLRPRNTLASTVSWKSTQDVLDYVRNFIRECSFLVHSVTAHNNSPRVLARIAALVNPLWELVSLKHPDLVHEALYTNVETGEREEVAETFWHNVAAQVQFSEQQLKDMRAAMQLYNSKIMGIMQDRMLLGQLMDHAIAMRSQPGDCHSSNGAELEVIVRHMQANLAAELAARRILIEMCSQKIISDYQRAMIFVSSFPYVADIAAVVTAVVETTEAASLTVSTGATYVADAEAQGQTASPVDDYWPSMMGDGDFMLPVDKGTVHMPAIKTEESSHHH